MWIATRIKKRIICSQTCVSSIVTRPFTSFPDAVHCPFPRLCLDKSRGIETRPSKLGRWAAKAGDSADKSWRPDVTNQNQEINMTNWWYSYPQEKYEFVRLDHPNYWGKSNSTTKWFTVMIQMVWCPKVGGIHQEKLGWKGGLELESHRVSIRADPWMNHVALKITIHLPL